MVSNPKNDLYTKLFQVFIVIQPILDILTFISLKYFNLSITVGIVIRVLFMLIALWFIFFGNNSLLKKYVITYLLILFGVFLINIGYNFFAKPVYNIFNEFQFIAKTGYFSIIFCTYLLILSKDVFIIKEKLLKATYFAMFIFMLLMFAAIITGTSSSTYGSTEFGFKGWYNSGNEISAIVATCFPLVYLYSLNNIKKLNNLYKLIPIILLAIAAILIGTKVGYLSVLISTLIFSFVYAIFFIINLRKTKSEKKWGFHFLITLLLLVIFAVISPLSPSFSNVTQNINKIAENSETTNENEQGTAKEEQGKDDPLNNNSGEMAVEKEKISSGILKIILSSRNIYFVEMYDYFSNAHVIQKMFGMGYAGNFEVKPKLIEMDFFDLFFTFGIVGMTIIMIPLIVVAFLFLKRLFNSPKKVLTSENIFLLLALGMGFGIAFFAGHVIYAPAVNIYIALALAILLVNLLGSSSKGINE